MMLRFVSSKLSYSLPGTSSPNFHYYLSTLPTHIHHHCITVQCRATSITLNVSLVKNPFFLFIILTKETQYTNKLASKRNKYKINLKKSFYKLRDEEEK